MISPTEQINQTVYTFYDKVRQDSLLGPVFERAIGDQWDAHLSKMCDFWQTVLFQAGTYKGNPMMAHLGVPDINSQHFERWLELFNETVNQVCDATMAELFLDRAARMRANLERGILQMRAMLAMTSAG